MIYQIKSSSVVEELQMPKEGRKISGVNWKSKVGCFVPKSSGVILVSSCQLWSCFGFKSSTLSRFQVILGLS